MIKKAVVFLTLFSLLVSLVCCGDSSGVIEHCEMRLTLGEDFYKTENPDFDITYTNGEYIAAVLRITFVAAVREGIGETMTPFEFAEYWIDRCGRLAVARQEGVAFCEYYDESERGESFYYLEAFYRSQYAYFVVLFAAAKDDESAAREKFLEYANSVIFVD